MEKPKTLGEKLRDVAAFCKETRQKQKQQKARKQRLLQIEDLYRQIYKVDKVALPIPNLFCLQNLHNYFGDLDNIDPSNIRHVGAIIYFTENQHKSFVRQLQGMSAGELEEEIAGRLAEIPVDMHVNYIQAVGVLLDAIKKNYLQHNRRILQQARALLEADWSTSSGPSASN